MGIVRLSTNTKPSPREVGLPDELFVDLTKLKHAGGEGRIYISQDHKYVIKIYHSTSGQHDRKTHLEQVILLGRNIKPEDAKFLCWPIAAIRSVDGSDNLGCIMRCIPASYTKLIDLIFNPRVAVQQFRQGISWANYLQVARSIARSAEMLSFKGVTHTDFSFNNFLANIQSGEAILIDLDSLVVPGFLPVKVTGTMGFMAPEVVIDPIKNPPNERSDRHALAVNILYTLLFRNPMQFLKTYDTTSTENDDRLGFGSQAVFSEHPTDHRNRPNNLGKPLFNGGILSYHMLTLPIQRLTEQALISGLFSPDKRPSAREWSSVLSWAIDELWQCSKCKLHFVYPQWIKPNKRACPFCGNRIEPNLLSLLRLYEPQHGGQYSFAQRSIVLSKGWLIYEDVVDPKRNPPITRRNEPRIGHIEWDERRRINCLINDENNAWQARIKDSASTLSIPRGGSIDLKGGTAIKFGEGRRILVVAE